MSNTVTTKTEKPQTEKPKGSKRELQEWLESDQFKGQIGAVLPRHVTPERMIRAAITATMRTPDLAKCDQASFFNQMLLLSQFGLEPDGRRAHLIPFWNSQRGCFECQLILDYKGIVELILRTGTVSTIHADKVCENDDFIYDCGQIVRHRIDFRAERGEPYAFYCIITRKDGTRKCEVMNIEEINAIRERSKTANNGPWVTDYSEMAKKTVFKRASKWVELSSEIRELMDADSDLVIDGEVVTPPKITAPRGNDGLREKLIGSTPQSLDPQNDTTEPLLPETVELTVVISPIAEQFLAKINTSVTAKRLNEIKGEVMESSLNGAEKSALSAEINDKLEVLAEMDGN